MSWEHRRKLLNPDLFRLHAPDQGPIIIAEPTTGMRMEVALPAGTRALACALSHQDRMPILKGNKNADGHIVLIDQSGGARALVVELKRTLRPESLTEALEQLCASRVRLEVVCAFLGLPITETILWIGVERTLLDAAATPDTALRKARIGGGAPSAPVSAPGTVDLPIGGSAPLHIHTLPSPTPLTPAPAPTPPPARPPAAPA